MELKDTVETSSLKDENVLKECRNMFYLDLETNKYSIKCQKDKFYDNVDEIFSVMKSKTDFIINKGKNDSDTFELNIIDKDKQNVVDEIAKEINNICA